MSLHHCLKLSSQGADKEATREQRKSGTVFKIVIRELKKTTTAAATSLNKRVNEQNNSCASAL